MIDTSEQTIRDRAYAIWIAAGMVGDAEHHWLAAERALRNEGPAVGARDVKMGGVTKATRTARSSKASSGAATPSKVRAKASAEGAAIRATTSFTKKGKAGKVASGDAAFAPASKSPVGGAVARA